MKKGKETKQMKAKEAIYLFSHDQTQWPYGNSGLPLLPLVTSLI